MNDSTTLSRLDMSANVLRDQATNIYLSWLFFLDSSVYVRRGLKVTARLRSIA